MSTFYDLPLDILELIGSYLDTYSLINLRNSDKRLRAIFTNNRNVRKFTPDPLCGWKIKPGEIEKYLQENYSSIETIDLSSVYSMLECHEDDSKNCTPHLRGKNGNGENPVINFHYSDGEQPAPSRPCIRKEETCVFSNSCSLFPSQLKFPINHLYNLKTTMFSLADLYVFTCSVLAMFEEIINIKNARNCRILKYIYMSNHVNTKGTEKSHAVVETLDRILVSPKLAGNLQSDLQKIIPVESVNHIENKFACNIHFFNTKTKDEFQLVLKKTRSIIRKRSTKVISVYGDHHCPLNNFQCIPFLDQISDIRSLSIQPCALANKVSVKTEQRHLFKKPRISRVTTCDIDMDVLQAIALCHKNIEILQIKHFSDFHNCNITNGRNQNWALNRAHLESIRLFKNLKYLTLSRVPFYSIDVLEIIFKNCSLLNTLCITGNYCNQIYSIPKNLHVSQNLKVLRLELIIKDINRFINAFNACSTLRIFDFTYSCISECGAKVRAELTCNLKKSGILNISTLHNFLPKVPNLKYLSIYCSCQVRETDVSQLKRCEKVISAGHPDMFVNFVNQIDHLFGYVNDIGNYL